MFVTYNAGIYAEYRTKNLHSIIKNK